MKKRRYEEGGSVREGENPNIDDDTRARARKWLESGSPQQETGEEAPKAAKPAAPKRSMKDEAEAKRQAEMVKKEKGLERVAPELDVLPIGKIAGLATGVMGALKGMSYLGRKAAAQKAEEAAVKKTAERAAKIEAGKQKARAARAKESGAMGDEAVSGEFRTGFKKGGSVSASRRGDGCAMRGKTRGKIY